MSRSVTLNLFQGLVILNRACPEQMLKQVQHDSFGVQHDSQECHSEFISESHEMLE